VVTVTVTVTATDDSKHQDMALDLDLDLDLDLVLDLAAVIDDALAFVRARVLRPAPTPPKIQHTISNFSTYKISHI